MKHIKIFTNLFEHKSIQMGQNQTGCGQEPPGTGNRQEIVEVKRGNHLICYNLKSGWLVVTDCPWFFKKKKPCFIYPMS